MKFKYVITIVAVLATAVVSSPTYIKKCRRNDSNINQCILNSARLAIPQIMKGDAALQIPDLNVYDPLDQVLDVQDVVYILKNIKHSSGELTPTYAELSFDPNHSLEIGMNLPFLIWKAEFLATGKHKGKSIDARGRVTISYDQIQLNYTKNFKDVLIDGKTYLQVGSESTKGSIDKISFVHNYDAKTVGKDELENMIPDIKIELQKKLETICSSLVTYAIDTILRTIPKEDIFIN